MADRKVRSVTFRLPHRIGLGVLKAAIEKEISQNIVVFQDLGEGECLLELELKEDAEELIEHGFDVEESHINCHPPQGKFVNVSIMGLRSYIEDEDVKNVLSDYGELKSEIIRLKYKADHELAGLQNGNRLVKMVLEKPSIPYSLRIGGEWCRIIQNNQQPVCTECSELGHTRKRCPKVKCRICHQLGHMSYNCELNVGDDGESKQQQEPKAGEVPSDERITVNQEMGTNVRAIESSAENMDYEEKVKGLKRLHVTDSDSTGERELTRRSKLRPSPNLTARKKEKKSESTCDLPPST